MLYVHIKVLQIISNNKEYQSEALPDFFKV